MAKRLALVLIVNLLFAFWGPILTAAETNGLVAIVNGVGITKQQFDQTLMRKVIYYMHAYGVDIRDREYNDFYQQMRAHTLNELVINELLLQVATELGVVVAEVELQKEVAFYRGFHADEGIFRDFLTSMGYSYDVFVRELELQLIFTKVGARLLGDREFSEEELYAFYKEKPALFGGEEAKMKVRHILVQSEEEAEKILTYLAEGDDFSRLAREYSLCPSGQEGGHLGEMTYEEMIPAFAEVVFALPVDEISEPVPTHFGWHIIQVLEKKEASYPIFAEVRKEVLAEYRIEKGVPLVYEYLEKALEKAKIEIFLTE